LKGFVKDFGFWILVAFIECKDASKIIQLGHREESLRIQIFSKFRNNDKRVWHFGEIFAMPLIQGFSRSCVH
jgi:hypothetical protein